MSSNVGTTVISLGLDSSVYDRELSKAKSKGIEAATLVEKSWSGISGAMVSAMRPVAAILAATFSVSFVKEVALLAARIDTLGVVLNIVGKNAGYTNSQMTAFTAQVEKMGITTQAARNSLTLMAQSQMDLTQASKFARVAQDAAVIGNINSSEAFQRMIYAVKTGQPEMLRTIGLNVSFEAAYKKMETTLKKSAASFTEAEKTQTRMNATIEAGTSIAGAYEASLGTAGKALLSLDRYIEQLKLKLGSAFQPALKIIVDAFTNAFKEAGMGLDDFISSGKMTQWANTFAHGAVLVVKAMGTITDVIGKVITFIDNYGTAIKAVAAGALVLFIYNIGVATVALIKAQAATMAYNVAVALLPVSLGGSAAAATALAAALSPIGITLGIAAAATATLTYAVSQLNWKYEQAETAGNKFEAMLQGISTKDAQAELENLQIKILSIADSYKKATWAQRTFGGMNRENLDMVMTELKYQEQRLKNTIKQNNLEEDAAAKTKKDLEDKAKAETELSKAKTREAAALQAAIGNSQEYFKTRQQQRELDFKNNTDLLNKALTYEGDMIRRTADFQIAEAKRVLGQKLSIIDAETAMELKKGGDAVEIASSSGAKKIAAEQEFLRSKREIQNTELLAERELRLVKLPKVLAEANAVLYGSSQKGIDLQIKNIRKEWEEKARVAKEGTEEYKTIIAAGEKAVDNLINDSVQNRLAAQMEYYKVTGKSAEKYYEIQKKLWKLQADKAAAGDTGLTSEQYQEMYGAQAASESMRVQIEYFNTINDYSTASMQLRKRQWEETAKAQALAAGKGVTAVQFYTQQEEAFLEELSRKRLSAYASAKKYALDYQQDITVLAEAERKRVWQLTGDKEVAAKAAYDTAQQYQELAWLSTESYTDGIQAAFSEMNRGMMTNAQMTANLTKKTIDGMADAMTEFIMKGKADWRSLASSIIQELIKIQIQKALTFATSEAGNWGSAIFKGIGAVVGAAAGGGDSTMGVDFSGAATANMAHDGRFDVLRKVPSSIFTNAPRLHKGLYADEFPAILQKGEKVTSAADVRKEKQSDVTVDDMQQEKLSKVEITNIVSPELVESYLASARGKRALMNIIGTKAGTIKKIMRAA